MNSILATIITLMRGIGYGVMHRRGLKRLAYREGTTGRLAYALMMTGIVYVIAIPSTLTLCGLHRLAGGWVFISLAYVGLAVILGAPLVGIVLYLVLNHKLN